MQAGDDEGIYNYNEYSMGITGYQYSRGCHQSRLDMTHEKGGLDLCMEDSINCELMMDEYDSQGSEPIQIIEEGTVLTVSKLLINNAMLLSGP